MKATKKNLTKVVLRAIEAALDDSDAWEEMTGGDMLVQRKPDRLVMWTPLSLADLDKDDFRVEIVVNVEADA